MQSLLTQIDMVNYIENIGNIPKMFEADRQYLDEDIVEMVESAKKQFEEVLPLL